MLHFDAAFIKECRERMRYDGYFDIMAGPALEWAVDIATIAASIQTLQDHGWAPSWILMYDEAWILSHQVKDLVYQCTGNSLITDFAFFNVGGGTTTNQSGCRPLGKGWPPHRDRGEDGTTTAFRSDGMPAYSTTWIPLTDATTINSCLYVVPKQHDSGYLAGDKGRNPLEVIFNSPSSFQAIRAIPSPAGSLVHFSHRLFHWGSSADPKARGWCGDQGPRVALSFASSIDSFEAAYFDRSHLPMPALTLRASLIAGLAIMYVANEDPGPSRVQLFWDVFSASSFDTRFTTVVSKNYAAYFAHTT